MEEELRDLIKQKDQIELDVQELTSQIATLD
jgi:prefoldin subunit 5